MQQIPEGRLFGTNGVRGVVNRELTPQLVLDLSRGVAQYINYQGPVLTGSDGRVSSPALLNLTIAGLTACGCDVETVGMAPTPAIQFLTKHWRMRASMIVTASHNPPEYNGVKVNRFDGIELDRDEERIVEKLVRAREWKHAKWDSIGKISSDRKWQDEYLGSIIGQVDQSEIQKRSLRVVVDPGNGVGVLSAPPLLERLGCKVHVINGEIDGRFPSRPSEPLPEHLAQLCEAVRSDRADFGVALDGDADRAIFVDELGEPHYGDRIFALIAVHLLTRTRGATIVTPVSSSQVIQDVADKYNGRVEWTKVGSVYVSHLMQKIQSPLGGEENGGIFLMGHHPVRDGAMATALIAEIISAEKRKLSELLVELPRYFNGKTKIPCPESKKALAIEHVKKHFADLRIDDVDGAKIWYPDRSWVLIRPSGTEPLLRVFAESSTRERVDDILNESRRVVDQAIRES